MRFITILFTLLLFTANAQGAAVKNKPLRVAIIDPSLPGNNDPALQIGVREIISACFVNYGEQYSIVERSQLDKIMQEAKFNNSDAVDESQATELGRLAGADRVVLSVISKMGNRSLVSIKMINVETASVEKQQSKLVDTESLLDVIEPITLVVLGEKSNISIAGNSRTTGNKSISTAKDKSKTEEIEEEYNNSQKYTKEKKSNKAVPPIEEVESNVSAQSDKFIPGELMPLLNAGVVNVVYDLSDASVEGIPLSSFLKKKDLKEKKRDYFQYFEDEFKTCISKFIDNANDEMDIVRLTYANNSIPIRLIIKVRHISDRGNNNICDYVFVDTSTGEEIAGIRMETKEGSIGSFTNLMSDCFKEAGGKFGGTLEKELKKIRKMLND